MNTCTEHYVYVIQMRTETFPDKLIRFLTGYEYSHVALALERDCKTTYSFGRRNVRNFLNSGFVVEQQNGPFFRKFNQTTCRIRRISATESQYTSLKKLLEYRQIHAKEYNYDFLGLILRFFRFPITFRNRSVCTQFAAEMLVQSGIVNFDIPTYFVQARSFDNCKEMEIIYEGPYMDYSPEFVSCPTAFF